MPRTESFQKLLAHFAFPLVVFAACASPDRLTHEGELVPLLSVAGDTAGRYIIVFKDGVSNADLRARQLAATYARKTRHFYSKIFKGFAADLDAAAISTLRQQPEVLRIIPEVQVQAHTTDATAGWGLGRIDQRNGPSDYQFSYTSTGSGSIFTYWAMVYTRPTRPTRTSGDE
jgi:peptidase inhibitor I9